MRRAALIAAAWLAVVAPPATAVVFELLGDEADDRDQIAAAADHPSVIAFREDLDRFERGILARKLPEIERTLGRPAARPAGRMFAMPVAQPRVLMLSGLRYGDEKLNKNHTDFHPVGDAGAVVIRYGIDGQTPAAVVVYLTADGTFPKLTGANLARRLAWDRRRFRELVREIAATRRGQASADAAVAGGWLAADEWPAEPPLDGMDDLAEDGTDGGDVGRRLAGQLSQGAVGVAVLAGLAAVGYWVSRRRGSNRA